VRLPRLRTLSWFGLLGAPLAWTVQHVTGFALTQAQCGGAGAGWDVHVDAWTIAVTAPAAAIAILAELASIKVFRETRSAEGAGGSEEPPPKGRVHFLATVGIVISPLFLFIILMSGLGTVFLPECVQS
jgi:hypothetical protein